MLSVLLLASAKITPFLCRPYSIPGSFKNTIFVNPRATKKNNYIRESLIHSVYCANGIFFRPAASEDLVHSAAISAVSFLAGQKIHSFIAITSFNQWFLSIKL